MSVIVARPAQRGGSGSGTWYQDEVLTFTDGIHYTLAHNPSSVVFLYLNGQLIKSITDYNRTNKNIVMTYTLLATDVLSATYT